MARTCSECSTAQELFYTYPVGHSKAADDKPPLCRFCWMQILKRAGLLGKES